LVSSFAAGIGFSEVVLTRFLESAGAGFFKEALSRFPEETAGACFFEEAIDRFSEEQVVGAGFFEGFSGKPLEDGFRKATRGNVKIVLS
jgi:hypothetical protein